MRKAVKLRPKGQVTLERALSKLGIASRTTARAWIEAGRIRVNGKACVNPSYWVNPEKARIEVDGSGVKKAELVVLLLNKPRGVVTTHSDEKGRATVFSLLGAEQAHLIAVGRLDLATSGLLLLTNDTRLASWLTDPANAIPRTYLVTVRGRFDEKKAAQAIGGLMDEGERLAAVDVVVRKSSSRESHLIVCLDEGKNREIRRLFLALGHEVTRLKRISFGGLELGDIEPGKNRQIGVDELLRIFPGVGHIIHK